MGLRCFVKFKGEAKWLSLYCTVCDHEPEFDVRRPLFAHMPDSVVVPTLGQSMLCSKCGTKGKIWSMPEVSRSVAGDEG